MSFIQSTKIMIKPLIKGRTILGLLVFRKKPVLVGLIFSSLMVFGIPFPSPSGEMVNSTDFKTPEEGEVRIQSNEVVVYGTQHLVAFKGSVVVEHEGMILEADDVRLFLRENEDPEKSSGLSFLGSKENQQVKKIEADGNVVFRGGIHRGQSEHAVYLKDEGVVVLTGKPEVWEGDSLVAGERITVLLKEKKSVVERSHVVLQPRKRAF